jgi:hypothetical protein
MPAVKPPPPENWKGDGALAWDGAPKAAPLPNTLVAVAAGPAPKVAPNVGSAIVGGAAA